MTDVFLLSHVHHEVDDDFKIIGVYATEASAEAAIARARALPGFDAAPDGFHVDRYTLDRDSWTAGYTTVTWE